MRKGERVSYWKRVLKECRRNEEDVGSPIGEKLWGIRYQEKETKVGRKESEEGWRERKYKYLGEDKMCHVFSTKKEYKESDWDTENADE